MTDISSVGAVNNDMKDFLTNDKKLNAAGLESFDFEADINTKNSSSSSLPAVALVVNTSKESIGGFNI